MQESRGVVGPDRVAVVTGAAAGLGRAEAIGGDEDGFANARIHGVNGNEVAAFGFAARIHRPRDEQLAAEQAWILTGRDYGPHDLR